MLCDIKFAVCGVGNIRLRLRTDRKVFFYFLKLAKCHFCALHFILLYRQNFRRFGLRFGTWYTVKTQTAPQQDHVYCVAVGRARKGVRAHPVPRHLHQRRVSPANQTDRSQNTGDNIYEFISNE